VGAWCFADHAGPGDLPPERRMKVGPHPHTGLATFSWMIEGEVMHRDSLGSAQVLRPGQVNLMTAGHGISHSEESLTAHPPGPAVDCAAGRRARPCAQLPAFRRAAAARCGAGWDATLLIGEFGGQRSPVPSFTPLLGVDLAASGPACARLDLTPGHEHGFMVLEGELELALEGHDAVERVVPGELL
jgi:redox-sensitive bicupin YhaK (pirin superfamily)